MRHAHTTRTFAVALAACFVAAVISTNLHAQGFPPDAAARRMTVAEEFQVDVVAAEPMIRQPVCIEFDDRGRLWVIQYLQYPNPAGLKRTKVDRYSRTTYDRVPEPPPRGPVGADRITILQDVDGDGRADKSKDFVMGLNLASGLAFGHGGVFVLQVPYLLFYPDRDRDDVPDGDPEVLVTGFGMEDAHSVANSLMFGPDGWLYGCQGSTVTAKIDGIEFQQGVWRYHPTEKKFELFCEGGGNSWGLDFDRHGNLLYSTNQGPYRMLHAVQGGYYWKQFGKHGALHNPYAYGYIDHVPHENFQGGHVTVGGMIYQSDAFSSRYRDRYVAGDLLGHTVYWNDLRPSGSSFKSINGEALLVANDTWFAPSDLTIAPDGAIYVADWADQRTAHPDPDAEWDRSNGRVYRIRPKGAKPVAVPEFAKLSTDELIAMLSSTNEWMVRTARRTLAERRDPKAASPLWEIIQENKNDQRSLQALWALAVSDPLWHFGPAEFCSKHSNPDVRRWTVRLLGDPGTHSHLAGALPELAASEKDVTVRSQLASTAKRLPPAQGLPIVEKLLLRDEDANDPHIPLLLWWAVERHAHAREDVLERFTRPAMWRSSLARSAVLGRLVRRYAAQGDEAGLDACARLLHAAPSADEKRRMVTKLDEGLAERFTAEAPMTPSLHAELASMWSAETRDPLIIRVRSRLGVVEARQRAATVAADRAALAELRVEMIDVVAATGGVDVAKQLAALAGDDEPSAVRVAALSGLRACGTDDVAESILENFPKMSGAVQTAAAELLLSRQQWASSLLAAVEAKRVAATMITLDQVRQVSLYEDRQLDAIVRKHWGSVTGGTPEEKLADVRRLNNDLRAAPGDPVAGRAIFAKTCGTCHKLFGEGADVGPDLTHANRKDRDYLLVSTVDPNAVVRSEYLNYVIKTFDGAVHSGVIAEQTPSSVTLKNAGNVRVSVDRVKIKEFSESRVSLMPEALITSLKSQDVRDLFAYLQGDGPVKAVQSP